MGILSSMYTGITGLRAQGEALSIYGDNISNSNTTGFKISRPEFLDGKKITIRFQYSFHYDKVITEQKHRLIIEEAMRQIFGQSLELSGIIGDETKDHGPTSSDMVSNLLKAFGGSVVE